MPICNSLETIAEELSQRSINTWELSVFPRDLSLAGGRLRVPRLGYFSSYGLTPYAQLQLAQFLGIRVSTFRAGSPSEQDRLFSEALERLLFPGYRMITLRGRGKEVRGIVDELCMPFSHKALVRTLWPQRRRFQVEWYSHQECAMHLRLLDAETIRAVRPDDYLIAGAHIGNSEVGFRPLTVDPVVFRLNSCGGIVGFGTRASTLSMIPKWSSGDIDDLFTAAVEEALVQATQAMDGVEASLRVSLPKPQILRDQSSISRAIPANLLTRSLNTLEGEDRQAKGSLYGLMNAVATVAQDLAPEARLKLESLSGRVVPRCLC